MSAANRLLTECHRAAGSGPDPYAALLSAQFRIVAEYHTGVLSTRQALSARSQLPECSASFLERWSHLQAACAVYDTAVQLAPTTPPSQWDAERLHRALNTQAALVSSLHQQMRQARTAGHDYHRARQFARHAAAERTFIAGMHAALDLDMDAAVTLCLQIVLLHDAAGGSDSSPGRRLP